LPSESPDLAALKQRLAEEDSAYAQVLDAIDALANTPLPQDARKELPEQMERLNALWRVGDEAAGGWFQKRSAATARQQQWNAAVVQVLNGQVGETAQLRARLQDLVAALVRYLQRVLPVMDARDRMATALATTRSELILEAFDRRLESFGRRLEGLLALRDRLETVSEQTRAISTSLAAAAPPALLAAAASRAAEDAVYVAFENRYRGDPEEIRERLRSYLPHFAGLAPLVDLGCGRGEFLALLKEAGIAARGVESNAQMAEHSRARGLEVTEADLLAFLRAQENACFGGIFAAQVAEHLPPAILQAMLREAHRTLRPGGLLILETVNPRSVVGFLEVYNRDLTHERPLHPDTLRFLAAASGFSDVRVEMRAPVDAASQLQPVPIQGLPDGAAVALNENVARLNALLYGPQEYALFARR
jgi:O-antigen chain-terminating methyltransferase